jgi:5-methylcytosine-specific restriction endonuclease McrA
VTAALPEKPHRVGWILRLLADPNSTLEPRYAWVAALLGQPPQLLPVTRRARFHGNSPEYAQERALREIRARFAETLGGRSFVLVPADQLTPSELDLLAEQTGKKWARKRKSIRTPIPTGPGPKRPNLLRRVLFRYEALCWWCDKALRLDVPEHHPDRATVEHLVPRSKGGGNNIENCRPACYDCNHRRGNDIGPPPLPPTHDPEVHHDDRC